MFLPLATTAFSVFGAGQSNKNQRENEAANMEANAEAIRYSPWTKMNTQMVQAQTPKTNTIANIGAGLLSGIQQGQNMAQSAAQDNLLKAQTGAELAKKDWYNNQQFAQSQTPGRQMGMMSKSLWPYV